MEKKLFVLSYKLTEMYGSTNQNKIQQQTTFKTIQLS